MHDRPDPRGGIHDDSRDLFPAFSYFFNARTGLGALLALTPPTFSSPWQRSASPWARSDASRLPRNSSRASSHGRGSGSSVSYGLSRTLVSLKFATMPERRGVQICSPVRRDAWES